MQQAGKWLFSTSEEEPAMLRDGTVKGGWFHSCFVVAPVPCPQGPPRALAEHLLKGH